MDLGVTCWRKRSYGSGPLWPCLIVTRTSIAPKLWPKEGPGLTKPLSCSKP